MGDQGTSGHTWHGRDHVVRVTHTGMGSTVRLVPHTAIPIPLRKDIEYTLPYYELRSS